MKRLLAAAAAAAGLAVLALAGPGRETVPAMPITLSGRATPAFDVAQLHDPQATLTQADLRGSVTLLNVWATWCVPCRQEHEVLMAIAREPGVRIMGLTYRDGREDALRWLSKLGNPYAVVGHDPDGRAARALGVVGAPETYVIDAAGRITHKHLGVLTLDVWRATLSPLVAALRKHATG